MQVNESDALLYLLHFARINIVVDKLEDSIEYFVLTMMMMMMMMKLPITCARRKQKPTVVYRT